MNRAGWEGIWSTVAVPGRYASFAAPDDSVVEWADSLQAGAYVFDLGCGIGRHVIYLGGRGFRMAGADISPTGIQRAHAACAERGLSFDGRVCDMTVVPWQDASFDAALSISTIHHGLRADITRAIDEVWRLLRPGGLFLVDFSATARAEYAHLRDEVAAGHVLEVEPNTFVDERSDSDDADGFLPHHFCDEADVRDLLRRFTLERVWLDAGPGGRGKWIAWARKASQ
jgi:SAM-dependent methyltransferase